MKLRVYRLARAFKARVRAPTRRPIHHNPRRHALSLKRRQRLA